MINQGDLNTNYEIRLLHNCIKFSIISEGWKWIKIEFKGIGYNTSEVNVNQVDINI